VICLLLKFKYLFCDGVYFEMRVARSIEKVSVLVVIGVTENGQKQVIGIQSGDKESASSWRETFKDLKLRGLNSQTITLGIMDGLSGLEKVFSRGNSPRERYKGARSTSHVMCWLRFPQKTETKVADDIRSIFYASSRGKQWNSLPNSPSVGVRIFPPR